MGFHNMTDLRYLIAEGTLKKMLTYFTDATGLAAMVVAVDGESMVFNTGEQTEFCSLVRSCQQGRSKCRASYQRAGIFAARYGGPYFFRCQAGLVGWAAPIIVDRQHLGSVICGQVLLWDPDPFFLEELEELNCDLQVDRDRLLKAVRNLQIISAEKAQAAAELLFSVCGHVIASSLETVRQQRMISEQQAKIGEEIRARKLLENMLENIQTQEANRFSLKREQDLLAKVRTNDREGAYQLLDELLADIVEQTAGRAKLVKARLLELFVALSRAAVEGGASLEKLFGLKYHYLEELDDQNTIEEMFFWIRDVLGHFMDNVYDPKDLKNAQTIVEAINFIRSNYREKFGVEDVARVVFLSPNYLGYLFKQELGCTVLDYATRVRIEHAKTLLANRGLSISEVADSVGFSDVSYFSKVFKKMEGVSPGQFRSHQRYPIL